MMLLGNEARNGDLARLLRMIPGGEGDLHNPTDWAGRSEATRPGVTAE